MPNLTLIILLLDFMFHTNNSLETRWKGLGRANNKVISYLYCRASRDKKLTCCISAADAVETPFRGLLMF